MKTKVNIRFQFRKPKKFVGSELAASVAGVIVCDIEVRGKPVKLSTHLKVLYGEWDANAQRITARTPAAKTANQQLVKMLDRLTDVAADLDRQGKPVTARAIMAVYQRNGALLDMRGLYEEFLAERKALVGIEIAQATYVVAKMRGGILAEFLTAHKLAELRPEEFTANTADKMLYWLLKDKGFKRNYANKVLQSMSQCLQWGVRREHLEKNPMALYEYKAAEVAEIKYLNVGEVQALTAYQFAQLCLGRVRDLFIFQCWTGLAYADLRALDIRRDAEYHKDGQGNLRRVLRVRRSKSTAFKGYECVIPLLPEAERILALYADKLPVLSNSKYNAYLKQAGGLCELAADKMTTHVGRKTAGVMMLNLGIRMETVSKFLGHSSVRMTEKAYAKILDTTVVDDFSKLFSASPAITAPVPVYELPAATLLPLRPTSQL